MHRGGFKMASDKSQKMIYPKFLILVLTGVITLLISQTIYGNTEKEYFEQRVLKLTAQTALRKVFTGQTYIRGHGKAYTLQTGFLSQVSP